MFEGIFYKCYKCLIIRNHGGKTPGELLKSSYLSYFVAPHFPILMKDFIPKIQVPPDFLTTHIADGIYANVYKVEFHSKPVAVKLLSSFNTTMHQNGSSCSFASPFDSNMEEINSRNKFFNELSMLHRCNHPSILRFTAFSETAHGLVIISEYIPETLHSFIRKKLPLSAIISIGIDIINALSYLHSTFVSSSSSSSSFLLPSVFFFFLSFFFFLCFTISLGEPPQIFSFFLSCLIFINNLLMIDK